MKAKSTATGKPKRLFFVLAIAMGCLIAAPPLLAQDGGQQDYEYQGEQQRQQQQQGQQQYDFQQQQQPADFDDQTIEKFADAHEQINEIRQEYSSEIRETQEPEKAQELQNKYRQQMVEAIHTAGLDVNEYNEIVHAMQRDPELQEKVDGFND